ncbi:MAG: hypothetical protein CMO80_11690 [Verrucomicrobiales bacterium]|nr:hypothetical protein [Verrucomicrobiales bacterium]
MSTQVKVRRQGDRINVNLQLGFAPGQSMMECEEQIQQAINQAGCDLTAECLRRFDTDGSPIEVADTVLTSKGRVLKNCQTPYGQATVPCHVCQSSSGGATCCPLDRGARIINASPSLPAWHPISRLP